LVTQFVVSSVFDRRSRSFLRFDPVTDGDDRSAITCPEPDQRGEETTRVGRTRLQYLNQLGVEAFKIDVVVQKISTVLYLDELLPTLAHRTIEQRPRSSSISSGSDILSHPTCAAAS